MFSMDIILLIIMIPTLLIMFFYEYPSNWKTRKFIFGVKNREEFKEPKAEKEIDKIVSSTRKQALIVMICSFVIMGLFFLIPDISTRLLIWVIFVIADLIIFGVPFMKGNTEMKSLKRMIGIKASGTTYVDLKNAGSVRALKISRLVIPAVVTAVLFAAAILIDLGIIKTAAYDGSFMMTGMTGSFLLVGLIMIPVAIVMDRIRNEVISEDSDTNMNYNRAKKKVFADTFVMMLWANVIVMALSMLVMFFAYSDIVTVILMSVYMILLMGAMMLFVKRSLAIERSYRVKTTIEADDDDKWILGSIYYNPDDKRLNVAKRMGIGGTINCAHPAGKVIIALSGVLIVGVIAVMVFVVGMGKSAMTVTVGNGSLICTQLTESYNVSTADIKGLELCEDASGLKLTKQVGFALDPVFNGTFAVNGQSGCKVFLNRNAGIYIKFEANGSTYYISADTEEATREIYAQLTAG